MDGNEQRGAKLFNARPDRGQKQGLGNIFIKAVVLNQNLQVAQRGLYDIVPRAFGECVVGDS